MSTTGGPEPVLRVTRLSKTYTATVVDSVDWQLEPGRIHALLGGNGSGKSTLLKMIAGVVRADVGGEIELHGQRYTSESYGPHASRSLRFVHQDLALVDELSVADNFGLARRFPRAGLGRIDDRGLIKHVAAELAKHGLDLDPRVQVGSLRPTERALVAIARAFDGIGDEPTTLVLDEPTASLPVNEVARLFDSLRALRDRGHSVVFVSHRLSEVAEIADDVTILRDGRVVGCGPIADFSESRIIELIAGHARDASTKTMNDSIDIEGAPALAVTNIVAGPLRGVDLTVRAGEIVGLAGLVGSGRSSVLRAIFGDLPGAGSIAVDGVPVSIRSTKDAVGARIGFVPEDRQRDAAFLDRPVWENLTAAVLTRYRRFGRLSSRRERSDAPGMMTEYRVRASSSAVPLSALSGGNQQKVIVARWMSAVPRVLLLDEPTQGVDAVARDEIHDLVHAAAHRGTAVVVVSSDLDELEQLSDRVLVLVDGHIVRELIGGAVNRAFITTAMHESGVTP